MSDDKTKEAEAFEAGYKGTDVSQSAPDSQPAPEGEGASDGASGLQAGETPSSISHDDLMAGVRKEMERFYGRVGNIVDKRVRELIEEMRQEQGQRGQPDAAKQGSAPAAKISFTKDSFPKIKEIFGDDMAEAIAADFSSVLGNMPSGSDDGQFDKRLEEVENRLLSQSRRMAEEAKMDILHPGWREKIMSRDGAVHPELALWLSTLPSDEQRHFWEIQDAVGLDAELKKYDEWRAKASGVQRAGQQGKARPASASLPSSDVPPQKPGRTTSEEAAFIAGFNSG